jgi:uncharacterized protein
MAALRSAQTRIFTMLHSDQTRGAAHRPRLALPVAAVTVLLLALVLSGCRAAAPAEASKHTARLQQWYPDPGAQALAVAAEQGNAAEVRRLMKDEGVNPDKHFAPDGTPLLGWPIFTKNPAGLKAMLENGADPNARYPTPRVERYKDGSVGTYYHNNSMVFAAKEDDPVYLKILLDHGGNPNTRNSNDETLLFQAYIWQNQWQNVQLLVERGADVNEKTRVYPIVSSYAISSAFRNVYWLLEHGADPDNDGARKSTLNAIFWMPVKDQALEWQVKCQRWVLARGYKRPPMPDHYRKTRADFGFPIDEKDIPLPSVKDASP